MIKRLPLIHAIIFFVLLSLVACTPQNSTPTGIEQSQTSEPTKDPAPPPTPTEEIVYVASVNGEGIRQSSYETSLAQFLEAQAEFGNLLEDGETAENRVVDALINRLLLAQAARGAGFLADESVVDARMNHLTEQAGSPDAMVSWMERYGYTIATFRIDLALEIEAAWQREQITNTVSETAEQVKARQIFFYDAYLAFRAYEQLKAGTPFENVAQANDPQNLGYLDWFPRGYLFFPELEAAAFSLPPGAFSEVIETEIGYHILLVLETDPNRPLSSDARLTLQTVVLEDWLAQKRGESQIDIFLP
jgi:peptidyl-prolyl cis-trans isomerase C